MDNRQPPLPFFLSDRCPELPSAWAGLAKRESLTDSVYNTSRPLKADSQAGLLARYLISAPGNSLTVQRAIDYLRQYGKVSNCPDRRLREARRWLEREGLVINEVERDGYSEWSATWDMLVIDNIRAKLTLGKKN